MLPHCQDVPPVSPQPPMRILSLLLPILVLAGCPGGMDVSRFGDRGPQQLQPDGGPAPVYDSWKAPSSDAKPISIDVKLPDSSLPKPDTKPALLPDKGPPPPPPAGNPCSTDANCGASQKCLGINGGAKKCYNTCKVTDACQVVSNCAQTEVCVMVNNNPALTICYPTAVPPGGTCGAAGIFCPNGTVCSMPSTGGAYKCNYTCNTPGATCAGGTCQQTNKPGCNICL